MEASVETKYRNAYHRDRPEHARCDEFSIRHPKMELGQRAKIFSPFSALRGFEEAIDRKRRRYVSRRELTEEEQARIDCVLRQLAARSRELPGPTVTVTCYVPCGDENHEAYGRYGTYETISGTLLQIDPLLRKALRVGETVIEFADIAEIRIETGKEG